MEDNEYSWNEYENGSDNGVKTGKRKKGKGWIALVIVACLMISVAGGYFGSRLGKSSVPEKEPTTLEQTVTTTTTMASVQQTASSGDITKKSVKLQDKNLSVVEIAEKCADSVVEVKTESVVTGSFMGQYISTGAGSGVIFTDDGYIVTCYHVIEGATTINVVLRDGQTYEAKTIGYDEQTDIAIIKIEATGLSFAVFGDSDALVVGEDVVAIGNPLGELGGTVTNGIISALSREIIVQNQTMTLLQTNAAINPGNSGGGLFDAAGQLVGVVNAKSYGEEIEGLGFAIPSNTAYNVVSELLDHGYVGGRINLGIELVDITTNRQAYYYGLDSTGVYVYSVTINSQAAAAGIQVGDRIVSINGVEITSSSQIEQIRKNASVGDTWLIEIVRSGKKNTVSIVLEEYIPR